MTTMSATQPTAPATTPPVPNRPPLPQRVVLVTALLFGFGANLLLRAPGEPGLGILLFFVGLAVAVEVVTRRAGATPGGEARALLAGGVLLGSLFVLRASQPLLFFVFLAAAAAFALAALDAGRSWLRRSGVGDLVEGVVGAMGYAGLGAFRLLSGSPSPTADASEGERGRSGRWPALGRGFLLAAPLLLVFGALFMSADPVFEGIITRLAGTALEEWASHALLTAVLAWLAAGYLTGFLTGTRVRHLAGDALPRPSVGMTEVGVALGLVNLLFALFVTVQFRYLFGGARLVEVTPGLTYAEYARAGFEQLALASALVLPLLLAADWLVRTRTPRQRALFQGLGSLLLLLLGVVLASAFQRVRVYQEAYGLTEQRFYGVVLLGWLAVLSLGFAATVLRGRREHFAFPALVSGFLVVAAMAVANPDAWIARTNLQRVHGADPSMAAAALPATPSTGEDRATSGPSGTPPAVDALYLASLSADAVPVLVAALPDLPPGSRCAVARRLLERWVDADEPDWRNWNLAVARARTVVGRETSELRAMARGSGPCEGGGGPN